MLTNGQITSRGVNSVNALRKDSHISRRYFYSVLLDKKRFYVSQKLSDYSLLRQTDLYRYIDCFELEKYDNQKCDITYKSCDTKMISKNKLPELYYHRLGNSLIDVKTLDGKSIDKLPLDFEQQKKRPFFNSSQPFYEVRNGYLVIYNAEYKMVDLTLIPVKEEEAMSNTDEYDCKSLWDYNFNVPNKLSEIIYSEAYKEIVTKIQIPLDENPNLNNNVK